MRVRGFCIVLFVIASCAGAAVDERALGDAMALRERGEFEKAVATLRAYIDQTSGTLSPEDRSTVDFEIERVRRIRQDYRLTREMLLAQIRERVPDFAEAELDAMEREGKLDAMVIDGQKLYVGSSKANLFLRVPGLRARWKHQPGDSTYQKLYAHMKRVKEAQQTTSETLVLPQDWLVTYTLVVKPGAAPDGAEIRCWLPFARAIPSQTEIHLLDTQPAVRFISQPEALHRTLYFEATAKKDLPTTFMASFTYRCRARVYQLDPAAALPPQRQRPEYIYYTAERKPHIDFSNENLRKIHAEITADGESNPVVLAKRIHDWIAKNTIYQFAREYSTLDNISGYTAGRRAGDCGQHGMLFIALCRMCGIPARWATGWEQFEAKGNNMHDWCEICIEPWGWIPVDPDMAVNFTQHSDDQLSATQAKELSDWMFGNMDNFRLTVNGDYGAPLTPPRRIFAARRWISSAARWRRRARTCISTSGITRCRSSRSALRKRRGCPRKSGQCRQQTDPPIHSGFDNTPHIKGTHLQAPQPLKAARAGFINGGFIDHAIRICLPPAPGAGPHHPGHCPCRVGSGGADHFRGLPSPGGAAG